MRTVACALFFSLASVAAFAGAVHPDLEKRLAALPPDAQIPVIVELAARADTKAAAKAAKGAKRARTHAVVNTLRDVAQRTQSDVKGHLGREQVDGHVRKVKPFWVFNGMAVTATEKAIRRLAKHKDVREVRLDAAIPPPRPRPMDASPASTESAWNIDAIRAPEVWSLLSGYNGGGIVVGSFDTGVDGSHPDLVTRYRGNHSISWFDPYGEHSSPYDNNGHGTHTVGTMVGGDLSGYNIGVAPGARWIAAKAWDDFDNATESAFHEIFEWFLAPGGDPDNAPDVINNSWGLDPALCFPDFRADVQALRAAGIVPVFAAGNSGPDASSVLAPGSYPESFTVGSTDFFDDISFFSSQGPSPCDGATKPNISAPGEAILSTFPGGDYFYLDGTSMAAPHISGAAAVLLSIDPTLTVEEVEAALVVGAIDLGPSGPDNAFGYGRLDLMESALIVLGIDKVGVKATTSTAYELGTVPGVFTVARTGNTDAPLTVTYTVGGTATPGTDYAALSGSVIIASGALSATLIVAPVDDTRFEYDETVTVTLNPVTDYVLSPVTATVTIVSDELPPDLVFTALNAPDASGAGLAITLTETTRNQGTGPAEASTTTYYLSTNDALLDASDVALATRALPALGPGATSSGSVSVTIPAGTPTGTHYLFARADSADAVLESSESNNVNSRTIVIGPDVRISGLTAPATGGAGATISVTDTTRNQGGGAAPASNTRYYLSANYAVDSSDVVLGARAIGTLAPGAADTGTVALAIPESVAAGTYYLLAKADGDDAFVETLETNNVYGVFITVGADLVVSSFSMPSDGGAGLTLAITDTTTNGGAGTAGASTTTYYLSTNNGVLDPADVALGSRAVPALAAGASSTGTVTVTIPAGTPTGLHYVYAKADAAEAVSEAMETNNTTYRTLRVGPDLFISSLASPAAAGAGSTITVTDTTRNQGGGAAPASNTRFYLSTNYTVEGFDVVLGTRAVPALAAGVADTQSVTLTIPAGTAPGTYYLLAKADGDDALVETIETNNVYSAYLVIGNDLVVTALNAPDATGAGATVTLTDTTRNQGGGTVAASTTTYYLSTNNGVLDAGDVVLGSRAIPALAAGVSDTGSVTVTIPAGTPTGVHTLFAKADSGELIVETSESNNILSRTVVIGPDLRITSLTAPAAAGAGTTFSVTDTTRNQGGGGAPASNTRFYLSLDYVVDAGDIAVGSRAIGALAAGVSSTGSASLTIPAGTAAGTYYLMAKADGDDALAETLETNNHYGVVITVGSDLVVSAFTMPSDAGAGLSVTVTDTTTNSGAGTAAASTTTFYLSTNNGVLDAGDVVLGSRAVPALASGASSTGSATVTIPPGTPTGLHYVYARADAGDVVGEASESNNTAYRTVRVGPDLVVTGITSPPAAGAGATITVSDTTRNQGGGAAPATSTRFYLSSDYAVDISDVLLGSRAIGALGPGIANTGPVSLTIPASVASGTYFLLAVADGDNALLETQEGNNLYGVYLVIGSDLAVTSFTAPDLAGAGLTYTFTDTTRNQGGGTVPASTTTYYLSTNNGVLDGSDVVLGSRTVPALAAGASDTGSVTVTLPAGTPTGTHYFFAKADSDGLVVETSETNNTSSRTVVIGPDVRISSLTAPAVAGAGATITVTDTTRNQGGGTAPASSTRFYLSVNYAVDGGDVLLGARAVSALAPAASETGTVTLAIPEGVASGTYYLLARADGDDAFVETLESNNIYGVYITIGSDLVISSLSMPANAPAGTTITITDTTLNQGGGAAGATTTTYYFSTNNGVLDPADAVLGTRAVPALAAGASSTGSVTVTIPAGTPPGLYYVYAKADAGDAAGESSETNNTGYRPLRVP